MGLIKEYVLYKNDHNITVLYITTKEKGVPFFIQDLNGKCQVYFGEKQEDSILVEKTPVENESYFFTIATSTDKREIFIYWIPVSKEDNEIPIEARSFI